MLLRLSLRTSSKVVATAFGIALCVMFQSGSISMLDGLRDSTDRVAARFDEGPIIAYSSLPLEQGVIGEQVLQGMRDPYCAVRVARVNVSYGGVLLQETYAASFTNDTILKASTRGLGDGEIWVSDALLRAALERNITIPRFAPLNVSSASANISLAYDRAHPLSLLPDDWVWVSGGSMAQLAPQLSIDATFILVPENSSDIPRLRGTGLTIVPSLASIDFFRQGVDSLEPALWGLAVSVGAIVCLLTFTLMALDVRYRTREMRTMKQIGAPPGFILRLVLLRSLHVSFLGGLLGIALGSILTNAITSFSPLFGLPTFTLPAPSLMALGVPLAVAVTAGLLGGAIPAASAARMRLVSGVTESS